MTDEQLVEKMCDEIRSGQCVDDVVDRYCVCGSPELRQKLIDGIREIVGRKMIEQTMDSLC